MNKVPLIISREYLSRVRKKSFIIMSLLGPILFAAMLVVPAWMATMEDSEEKTIAVVDQTGLYTNQIENTELLKFKFVPREQEETLKNDFKNQNYYAFLVIDEDLLVNPNAIAIYSDAQITVDVKSHVRRSLESYLEGQKLKSFQIEGLDEIVAQLDQVKINLSTIKVGEDGTESKSSTELTMIISIVFAFMSYMFIFIYGAQVMRGVMEEKTNRIVEVIISSVKPFQLMMGKIIGIALVALTQILLWVVLTVIIVNGVKVAFFSESPIPNQTQAQMEMMQQGMTGDQVAPLQDDFNFSSIMEMVKSMEPIKTLLLFVFYFFGGYLLYAALFAAVGAAIDNETDQQQFMLPITLPIILALYVAMMAYRNPGSDLAFWFSMVPFTSPIVMMARIPFNVPLWELLLSMVLLIGGFILTTWFAARIYRTGILMYGKKVNYKELWKWFRYSGK
jgi:ABC-2 type transport system permease protein